MNVTLKGTPGCNGVVGAVMPRIRAEVGAMPRRAAKRMARVVKNLVNMF